MINYSYRAFEAIDRGREEVLPEPVPGEGPGFTHQGPDDVPSMRDLCSPRTRSRRSHHVVFVVDLQIVGVLVNFHLVAAQPGGYAVGLVGHPDGAPFLDLGAPRGVFRDRCLGQRPKIGPLYI